MTESSLVERDLAAPTRLWASFARQVQDRPDATALVWQDRPTTYRELHDLALVAEATLERLAPGAGAPVGLPATKSPRTIAVVLACLRAGRPVMLPSPTLPAGTLDQLFARAGFHHVLATDDVLPPAGAAGPGERATATATAGPATVPPATPADPADVAFVLTTSGSTRLPKVVPIGAGAVERFADWAAGHFGLGRGAVVLNYAPLNFDLCFLDVWATLHHGGTVVLVDPDTATRGDFLLGVMVRTGVTFVQSVPMLYRLLLDAAGDPPTGLPAVRHVVFTGDHMPPTLLARLPQLFPEARLHHVYGCTETNDSFLHEVDPSDLPGTAVPLGRPLPGALALVLDEDGAAVTGPGRGELLVATAFQTTGYLGEGQGDEPDANVGRFVTNLPGAGGVAPRGAEVTWYRTGDLVRRDRDGRLFLEGRNDFQVKVRGTRVNTADVEQALLEHEDVLEAAVVALPDAVAGHLLHAVLRRAPGAGLNSLVLRKHCARRLPPAAIPTTLRLVDEPLPTTPTGKVDRQRLGRSLASS